MSTDNTLFHDPKKLRRLVGTLAFLLPLLLLLISLSMPQVCTHKTISHYYFAPLGGDILVGILFFIGFFLICYKGDFSYGASTKWDDYISTFAGLCAFGIALFPADGYSCLFQGELTRAFISTGQQCETGNCHAQHFIDYILFSYSNHLHAFSTAGFFLALAYFSLFIFTKSDPTQAISAGKRQRNRVYLTSGTTILVILTLMGTKHMMIYGGPYADIWDQFKVTFILETIGLFAFGIAWWVKGGGMKLIQD